MLIKCECDCKENHPRKKSESLVSYLEREFAPIKFYKIQYCCPICGMMHESVKHTDKGVGFYKWVGSIIRRD